MRKLWTKILKLHQWCNRREWILILLIIVALVRLPTLFTPHYYGDEEIYFVMGRAWSSGVPLYEAMFDHKPPLIYVVAGLFPTIPLFRGFLMLSMLLHTFLFWKLAKKFWGKTSKVMVKISSIIFVILSTLPTFEGHIVNAELLMMLPITASLLLIWDQEKKEKPLKSFGRYLGAGLIAGIGWLYKIPVMFDVVAIILFLLIFSQKTFWKSVTNVFSAKMWLYLVGFVTPLLLSFGYYYLKGHGESYLATVFTVNLGYVSSWKSDSFTTFNPFKSGLVVRGILLMGYTLLLYVLRHKIDKRLTFAALWLGYAVFGALLSYRPYPHYLQEIVPAISLFIPTIFTTSSVLGWFVWGIIIAAGILIQRDVGFWAYDSKELYQSYWQMMRGVITKDEYRNKFDNAQRNYMVSNYILGRLDADDKIYVWGSDPTIYNLTNRLPSGGKYIVSFHVRDLEKYDYVSANLKNNKPKAIIVLPGERIFEELETEIAINYVDVYEYEGAVVYWRID